MKLVAFDTETRLIGKFTPTPHPICVSIARKDSAELYTAKDSIPVLLDLFRDDDCIVVGHNLAFDTTVMFEAFPELREAIIYKYSKGLFADTKIREKLLHLSSHGDLVLVTAGGFTKKIFYSLAALEKNYKIGDASARNLQKTGADAWRLRYEELEDLPVEEYPPEAQAYALEDAVNTRKVFLAQERVKHTKRFSLETQEFHTYADFCLRLISTRGMLLDQELAEKVIEKVSQDAHYENFQQLLKHKIIMRPEFAKGENIYYLNFDPATDESKAALARYTFEELWKHFYPKKAIPEDLLEQPVITDLYKKADKEWNKWFKAKKSKKPVQLHPCIDFLIPQNAQPSHLRIIEHKLVPKKGAKEVLKRNSLQAYIQKLADKHENIELSYTNSGGISTDKRAILSILEEVPDPVLLEYLDRSKKVALRDKELPRLREPKIFFLFDALKETGRTSSYGDKLVNSTNGQNIDPRARICFVPREGNVFIDCDFSSMELVTLSNVVKTLTGRSKLYEQLEEGVDPHEYLGAILAYNLDDQFRAYVDGISGDPVDLFRKLKTVEQKAGRQFYKHYRKLAKPTGLGYPGGLGPKTFVSYSRSFGCHVDVETAARIRNIWYETYPEMRDYFACIKQMVDPNNPDRFYYVSPKGMVRVGCKYTEISNGIGLQTPGAEGAKNALIKITELCYTDPLFEGSWVANFIHDEIIIETPEKLLDEKARVMQNMMSSAFAEVIPSPKIGTSCFISRRWQKDQDPTFVDGKYVVNADESHQKD